MNPKPHRRRTIGITEAASRELLSAAMAYKHRTGSATNSLDIANAALDAAVEEAVARLDSICAVPARVKVGDKVRVTPKVDGLPSSVGDVVAFHRDGWAAVRFAGEPSPIHIPVSMLAVAS